MNPTKRKARAKAKAKALRTARGKRLGPISQLRKLARDNIRRATIVYPEGQEPV